MFRRPSLLVRVTRALVGLVTVWCLGCFGYEPIVDAMRGTRAVAGMDCDSMMASSANSENAATAAIDGGAPAPSAIGVASTHSGFDCGCGGLCHAVSITYASLAHAPLRVPLATRDQPAEPTSITRSPLPPPPQRAA